MNPKEIYAQLKADNFPMLVRADTVITNHIDSKIASMIRFRSKLKGNKAYCNHEEMYLLNGQCIGANKKVEIGGLDRFFDGKHEIYIFRDKLLDIELKNELILEAIRWYGTRYDALGIVWQALDAVTFSTLFSRTFNKGLAVYCSEYLQRVYWNALRTNPSISEVGAGTPNDSFLYKVHSPDFTCVLMLTKEDGVWKYYAK